MIVSKQTVSCSAHATWRANEMDVFRILQCEYPLCVLVIVPTDQIFASLMISRTISLRFITNSLFLPFHLSKIVAILLRWHCTPVHNEISFSTVARNLFLLFAFVSQQMMRRRKRNSKTNTHKGRRRKVFLRLQLECRILLTAHCDVYMEFMAHRSQ